MSPRSRAGFTFVELLFAMVVIVILVGIGIPRFRDAKKRAQREMVLTHLRNLMTSQEAYFTVTNQYTTDMVALAFETLPTVTAEVVSVSSDGYQLRVSENVFSVTCAVYTGSSPQLAPAVNPHEPACDQ